MKIFITSAIMVFAISGLVFAGPKDKTIVYTNKIQTDQDRCQAEANYMAANNITNHVWGTIGSFEGIGYGNSPNCRTCTPRYQMTPTGDAVAQGRNGMWYRVRSWR